MGQDRVKPIDLFLTIVEEELKTNLPFPPPVPQTCGLMGDVAGFSALFRHVLKMLRELLCPRNAMAFFSNFSKAPTFSLRLENSLAWDHLSATHTPA